MPIDQEEFSAAIDEPDVILCGHEMTLIFEGRFWFDCKKNVTKIEQKGAYSAWRRAHEWLEVCPVLSKPLYDALYSHAVTTRQECMDDAIRDYWDNRPTRGDSAWADPLPL
jgi:hypothetical protein